MIYKISVKYKMPYTLHLYTENPELKQLYQNHKCVYEGDCGVDLFIPREKEVSCDRTHFISHEIVCWMTDDVGKLVSYYLYPRSSISKTPYRLANSVGIIDSGYRGEIIAAIDVLERGLSRPKIEQYTRLFQLCAPTLERVVLVVEDTISHGDRGTNGFGSTGK